jgi:phosphoglycerate dehydrogenase-like enzyme
MTRPSLVSSASTTSVLDAVPELRIISKYGVGLDGLDLDAIARRGIKLGWSGGVNRRSVSELTLSFAIALMHRVPETTGTLRDNAWRPLVGRQLTGKTIGIVGCGFVGQDLVRLLAPFECRVLANDIRDYPDFYRAHHVTAVTLDARARRIGYRHAARASRPIDERHDWRRATREDACGVVHHQRGARRAHR